MGVGSIEGSAKVGRYENGTNSGVKGRDVWLWVGITDYGVSEVELTRSVRLVLVQGLIHLCVQVLFKA